MDLQLGMDLGQGRCTFKSRGTSMLVCEGNIQEGRL